MVAHSFGMYSILGKKHAVTPCMCVYLLYVLSGLPACTLQILQLILVALYNAISSIFYMYIHPLYIFAWKRFIKDLVIKKVFRFFSDSVSPMTHSYGYHVGQVHALTTLDKPLAGFLHVRFSRYIAHTNIHPTVTL